MHPQVKANFTLTPKSGKEIDTKSIAEASFNQTAKVIESSTEEELQLLQLDISGHQMYDNSVVDTLVAAAEEFGLADALAGVGSDPSDVVFLKLLRGRSPEVAIVNKSQPIEDVVKAVEAVAEHVYSPSEVEEGAVPTKKDVNLSTARIALVFTPKAPSAPAAPGKVTSLLQADDKPTQADLDKIAQVLATELGGNFTQWHFLCSFSEFQKVVAPSTAPAAPQGSDTWTDEQKQAYANSLKDPSELITKYAVRCAVLIQVTVAQLQAVAGKLRWYWASPLPVPVPLLLASVVALRPRRSVAGAVALAVLVLHLSSTAGTPSSRAHRSSARAISSGTRCRLSRHKLCSSRCPRPTHW